MTLLPLQVRLTCYYVAMSVVVLGVCATTVYVLLDRHLQALTDVDLLEELTELSLEVQLAPAADRLQRDLEQRFDKHGEYRMRVEAQQSWAFEGGVDEPWSMWPRVQGLQQTLQWETVVPPGNGSWRVVGTRITAPSGVYFVQAAASTAPSQATIHSLATAFLITAPCALLLTAVAGYWSARQALAPIREIARTAERISGAALSERIAEPAHSDELGQLVRTLNAMLGRLQAAMEQMRRFTADAAHELRTPLSVVMNEIEVLLRSSRSSQEYELSARRVLGEVHRLTQIVSQLLALSRLDAGIAGGGAEEVRLDALLADVVDQCRKNVTLTDVCIVMERTNRAWVMGDDLQLSRLYFNLVDNAARSCGPKGQVAIRCRSEGNEVEVGIEDNGTGISAEELPLVFQRFFRGASGKAYSGSGLGLAICESIVTAHLGRISVVSELGKGTIVRVWLPASPGEDDTAADSGDASA